MLSAAVFAFISLLLFSFAPYLSVRAAQDEDALTTEALKNVVSVDYKEYFGDLDGSFVLYDMQEDTWYVYNRAQAERRISPDSTYKVYDALFGLEEGVIAPDLSLCGLELRSGFGIRYGKFCELVFSVHRFPAGRREGSGLSAQNKLWKPGQQRRAVLLLAGSFPENFSPGADRASHKAVPQ